MLHAPISHYLLTASLSRQVDQRTIEEISIDSFTLMEIAGFSAAQSIRNNNLDLFHGLYFCGKGNNGGDALVVARYLLQHGIAATIIFVSGTDDLSADAKKNVELLQKFDYQNKLSILTEWKNFDSGNSCDFIVDGMLGTGLDSDLRGDYKEAAEWMNNNPVPTFAMDIPTGLHADTGQLMGTAVQATETFAFGGRKQGCYFNDGPSYTGKITYCELPFPNHYKSDCQTFLLDESWISSPPQQPGHHKYASGVLYIIAGSEGLTGAAILAAQSAWAEGLGAVILISPRGLLPIYEQTLPSIIKKPVGKRSDDHFTEAHLTEVLQIVKEKEGAVLLGPGLGRKEETMEFTNKFLAQNNQATVIDADGLWSLAQSDHWNRPTQTEWILTPHPGELNRFRDGSTENNYDRLTFTRKLSSANKITVLSKGEPGIIGTSSGKCYLTNYNTRYFARAGCGDVLAGKTGAYLALGNSPEKSCARGLLNGKKKLDQYQQDATDLPEPKDFI